jgi:PAS domain S-box-containing protein
MNAALESDDQSAGLRAHAARETRTPESGRHQSPLATQPLTVFSTLADLPTYHFEVEPTATAGDVGAAFSEHVDSPGVLITSNQVVLGVISRRTFFEAMGQLYGTALYFRRPIQFMFSAVGRQWLQLASNTTIEAAASQIFQRPEQWVYEPILVEFDGSTRRLLDVRDLLFAQTHLLANLHGELRRINGELEERVIVSHHNIAQLKRAQLALQESEALYRGLVDYSPDLIGVHREGRVLFINPAGVKLLGAQNADEVVGQPMLQIVPVENREAAERGIERIQATGEASPLYQQTMHRLDGTAFDAEIRIIPISYAGQPALQFVMRDVTERKRSAEQIRQNAARAEALARVASILNSRLDLAAVSRAICEETARAIAVPVVTVGLIDIQNERLDIINQVGLPPDTATVVSLPRAALAALTRPASPLIVPTPLLPAAFDPEANLFDELNLHTGVSASMVHNGQMIGFVSLQTADPARQFTAEDRALLKGLADQAALAISNAQLFAEVERQKGDLELRVAQRTEELNALNSRLQMELAERQALVQSLGESEQLFRVVFDASPDAIFLIDPHDPDVVWPVVDCNQAGCQMNGYTREELIGQSIDLINVAAGTREAFGASLDDLRRQGAVRGIETSHRHKDGHIIPIEYSTSLITVGSRELVLGIDRDASERQQQEAALREAKDQAESASRAKSEFLSRMSHELRTPMNAILGFAQLLTMSRKDPLTPGQLGRVQQVVKGGQHLLDLINEVLDMSRIEAGRVQISTEPVQVLDVLQEVLDLTAPLAADRGIQIQAPDLKQSNPYVLADRQRLKQILLNLLSNAVKYNQRGGAVRLSCAPAPRSAWRIAVTDTGPGIAPNLLGRLFIPFERLAADQSNVEGTGLGLALAKRLVELMNGQIGVESVVGQGSMFWFELPEAEGQVAGLQRKGGTWLLPVLSAAARSILYVEDNRDNFELVRQALADYLQIELIWAREAEVGLQLARQRRPSLILLDLHLYSLSGADVLSQLKQNPNTAAIPVIIVSADATPGQVERLLALGARAYLTKPINVKTFVQLIEGVLEEKTA